MYLIFVMSLTRRLTVSKNFAQFKYLNRALKGEDQLYSGDWRVTFSIFLLTMVTRSCYRRVLRGPHNIEKIS